MSKTKNAAIIVAAGKGLRMKAHKPKQFMPLSQQPILRYTLIPFIQCNSIHEIIVVVPESYIEECTHDILKPLTDDILHTEKKLQCIEGGARRQDSVFNGLQAVTGQVNIVVIHDGVRPFIKSSDISQLISQAREKKAVITGIKPRDTVKLVDQNHYIKQSIDRNCLQMAQTPQAFSYELIKRAHEYGQKERLDVTDDAMLIEHMGEKVFVASGHSMNIKITTPDDLLLAQAILPLWINERP